MRTSIWTRLAVVAVALCAVAALAAPASALTLRRDGSKAVPFVPYTDRSAPAPASDAFDWGDAAIGAGVGTSVLIAASGAAIVLARRRREAGLRPMIGAQEGS